VSKSNLHKQYIIISQEINIMLCIDNAARSSTIWETNMSWLFLILGVVAEAMSHVALKETNGFTKVIPSALVLMGHLAAFVFLGQAMKGMPIGIVHALWAGLAIVTVTLLSTVIYRQHLDLTTWFGMAFVAIGVAMINLSQGHSH
jgi:small multidrug resistance pump